MKKIIAFSVLLVLLSAAVFAQDGSGWKVGFTATASTDLLYFTDMTAKAEIEETDVAKQTYLLGEKTKGSFNFFNSNLNATDPTRVRLELTNSGENHDILWQMDTGLVGAIRDDYDGFKGSLWDFFGGNGWGDWHIKVNGGMFDAKLGASNGYKGFVQIYEPWSDWFNSGAFGNEACAFGVYKGSLGDFQVSDDVQTWNRWGPIFAMGASFTDSIKFAVGTSFIGQDVYDNPLASASSTNASFILSAKDIADKITFDVFYSVMGGDENTAKRQTNGAWDNIFGVYVGLALVDNLGLSIGYTGTVKVDEKWEYISPEDLTTTDGYTKGKPMDVTNPFYSGIDIKVNYTGIDKAGITFNNNVSFVGVTGADREKDDPWIVDLNGDLTSLNFDKANKDVKQTGSQSWFGWDAVLKFDYSLTDNVGITLHLGNKLGVSSDESTSETTAGGTTIKNTKSSTTTTDAFRVYLTAGYSVSYVSFSAGLVFDVEDVSYSYETETTGGPSPYKKAVTSNYNVIKFGIPLLFKVAF